MRKGREAPHTHQGRSEGTRTQAPAATREGDEVEARRMMKLFLIGIIMGMITAILTEVEDNG